MIEGYSLVGFLPLSIKVRLPDCFLLNFLVLVFSIHYIPQDRESMYHVVKNVDRITGYSASDLEERKIREKMANAPTTGPEFDYSLLCNMQEKYIRQETDEMS